MPVIIITGTPCSGKTRRAQQIAREFECRIEPSSNRSIVLLSSYHASRDPAESSDDYRPPEQNKNPRDVIYENARQEKTARAEEFSAIKRAVNKNTIVIADSPNYIKGFRYQLFCEAKAAATRSVVVHTAARDEECIAWNNARLEAWAWSTEDRETGDSGANGSSITGPKIGKDILGDLDPTSHTAIYGDKIVHEATGPKSRSSSTGAAVSDNEDEEAAQKKLQNGDTMTLKSLYISDTHEQISSTPSTITLTNIQESISDSATPPHPLPPSTPPNPRSSLPYSPSTLRSLSMRYEPPSPFTRWDTPLFTIPSTDAHPPYNQIWDAIFPPTLKPTSKKALQKQHYEQAYLQKEHTTTSTSTSSSTVRPHASTVLPSSTSPTALQTLESTTHELTKLVLAASRAAGDEEAATLSITVSVDGADEHFEIEKPAGVSVSQPTLQRLRRKYTQMQRGGIAHGRGYVAGRRDVVSGFVEFLEREWRVEGGEEQ